jgi:hypothetical protein
MNFRSLKPENLLMHVFVCAHLGFLLGLPFFLFVPFWAQAVILALLAVALISVLLATICALRKT